jgi:crotonobetainyl-CoA:carnitine CoA-transferase CaiB-like acyl-CoA transferase
MESIPCGARVPNGKNAGAAMTREAPSDTVGALSGVKILDLTHIAAGPFATMLLADMGADVIKVERPGQGDGARQMDLSIRGTDSGYYLGLNKNKRSIAVDLSSDEGRQLIRTLASSADVFVENFRPSAAERLGLGYSDIRAIRPDIVYCSISGFGAEGPLRHGIAYDIIGQAMSGIMSITGEADRPPAKCGAPIADLSTGMFAALGILAALNHRLRTGEGQHVATSLLGSSAALVASYVTSQALGTPFDRVGSAHNTLAPYQAFSGSDGQFFILAAGNDGFFEKAVRAIAAPELLDDPRYKTNSDRVSNRAELAARMQRTFNTRSAEHWTKLLGEAGLPVSPIYDITRMVNDPQVRANGYIVDVDQPEIGLLPMITTPIAFSATPVSVRRPAPGLDEHHNEIMSIGDHPASW